MEMSLPEPMPSLSTPIPHSTDLEAETNRRPRRHTITRPDSAMALLSDDEELSDDDQQTLDRISDILASLIQEANDAVKKERIMIKSVSSDFPSRIPRLKKRFNRTSISSTSSTLTSISTSTTLVSQMDPLAESCQRLDSSMAMVDSLSRDLASPEIALNSRLILFLLVPLLHIPHSFITMLFDLCYSDQIRTTSIFDLSSMLVWTCLLALANLVVSDTPSKKSLPGSFSPKKPRQTTIPNKRTWIPTTLQTQHQFRLGEEVIPPFVRRNSI